jgi:hypothetical protein
LEHVADLTESFLETGTVSKHGVGCVINTSLWEQWKAGREITQLECESQGIVMISGNHTRVVQTNLKRKYPRNPTWQRQVYRLVLVPDDANTTDMLRIHGLIENFKNKAVKRQDWWNACGTMHRQSVAEAVHFSGLIQNIPMKYMTRMKLQWKSGMKNSINTVGTWFQIAKRQGEFWDRIVKCVTGVGVARPNTFTKFSSASHWVPMSGMPDEEVQQYLDEVILGEINHTEFKKKCQTFKCTQRYKLAVADHVETLLIRDESKAWDDLPEDEAAANAERWNWVVEHLSTLADQHFINTYVKMRYAAPVKEPFPETLFDDCKKAYDSWKKKVLEELVEEVCIVLIFFVLY